MSIIYRLTILFFCFSAEHIAASSPWPNSHGMDTAELEKFLTTAKVISMEETELGITQPKRIILEKDGIQMRAVFKSFSTKIERKHVLSKITQLNQADRYENDYAAYQLDQLLGLNMVPVTVIRRINNTKGAVQFWIEDAIIKKYADNETSPQFVNCGFEKKEIVMHIFDILIYNDDRNSGNVLYTVKDCRLWMIDHSRSFRVKKSVPAYLSKLSIKLTEQLAKSLPGLNEDNLTKAIGTYIDPTQINFILKRRDEIMEKWRNNGSPGYSG